MARWINLNLSIILLNSSGNKKSSLFSPKDRGNKIYCSKKDCKGILEIISVIVKQEINNSDPKNKYIIFLISKLKTK